MLSNRNHPFGRGNVLRLQGTIADAAVHALRRASSDVVGRLQLPAEAEPPPGELRRGGG